MQFAEFLAMTKTLSSTLMICVAFMLITLTLARPNYLSDGNFFLKDFVGSSLLNVLGVILAITLASSAQLHLEFNKMEERHNRAGFKKSRAAIRGANIALIVLFVIAVVVLVVKSAARGEEMAQSFFNSVELYVLFLNVILLVELTQAAFSIKAHIKPVSSQDVDNQKQEPQD